MTTFKCIESLEENPVDVFLEVSSILLKLVDNVLHYPSNPKYRKLRLENKLVSTVIIPSIGAMECLFEIGFEEGDDSLLLPPESTSMDKLRRFREEISVTRKKYLKDTSTSNNSTQSSNVQRQSTPQPEAASETKLSTPVAKVFSSNPFLAKLHQVSSSVLQYEQESTRLKALSVMPVEELSERVQHSMRVHQQSARKPGAQTLDEASLQETLFFTELMDWFKNDFFQWVNTPKCPKCSRDTEFIEMSSNAEELAQASRVEVYRCDTCMGRVTFPRFNAAAKLLDTRKGRCGEWANAFTALCRALGWEARYILDETDHVWTEVWFKSQERWVHCDPCECALDKPLLYEKGWDKQLSYVIAFSCEDVQDVTWRYSANHSAVLARRKLCSEAQLVQTITELNRVRQAHLSGARRKVLARRTVLELVELMSAPRDTEGDDEGRQSGSLTWRLSRGETSRAKAQQHSYTFTPTSQEVEAGRMVISYCTATDMYGRGEGGETQRGWDTMVSTVNNMFRKEERDWKTVYLCRTEGSGEGRISWQVDVSESGLRVGEVQIRCPSTVFQSGKVIWLLCSGEKCVRINNGELDTSELRGSTAVTLSATLTGGEGREAWQHAQLLRQPLDVSDPAFRFCLTLIKP